MSWVYDPATDSVALEDADFGDAEEIVLNAILQDHPTVIGIRLSRVGTGAERLIAFLQKPKNPIRKLMFSSVPVKNRSSTWSALDENSSYSEIRMEDNGFGDLGACYLALSIIYMPDLKTLHIVSNKVGDRGLTSLVCSIELNRTLTDLSLRNNLITTERHMDTLCRLTRLDLSENLLDDKTALAIADRITNDEDCHLVRLNLRQNRIGPVGASSLLDSFLVNLTLTSFDLSLNPLEENDVITLSILSALLSGEVNPQLLR